MPGLLFTLTGRDELSDVMDDIGDAARRLHRRISAATTEADRDMRRLGRTMSTTLAGLRRDSDAGAKAVEELGKVTRMLWPAAIPAAASLAPIAAGAGTVAVAVAAMGAALGPQIAALGEASEAQKKYDDAVETSGATSQEAITAQVEYQRILAKMPKETREASVAVGLLKDNYQEWSDALAADTMAPFTKGVGIVNALLPKTSGLVKVTADEADRFMTVLGGTINSPGLDALNGKFTNFAQRTLRGVNDQIVHLLRVSENGEVGGNARRFMDWARAQGPTVASVLSSIATTLINVLEAGSDVGVGLLQAIDVLAQIVSAVPPGAIALFLQLALAMKVTKAAALGLAAGRTALAAFGVQLVAMHTAAAAAPGRLGAVTAAIGALSRGAKIAVAGTGIGLLVMAFAELSSMGESAPPSVDKLTTSLGNLGRTGKVTGYAAQQFGADFGKLQEQISKVTNPSVVESINNWGAKVTGGLLDAGDATEEFTKSAGSVDEALTNLVRNGNAKLAKAALADILKGLKPEEAERFRGELGKYDEALADLAFEQKLTAESQGLFGAQAQQVQAKLDAQKASADGLRQSLQALNEAQRAGLGGMIGFEASIDSAAKAAKDNADSLDMVNGRLDVNSPKAQAAATALNDLAAKTDEAAAQARQSTGTWEAANQVYERGRQKFIETAIAMGLTKTEAAGLADQIMKIPDKDARVDMNTEDATAGLEAFNAKVAKSPGAKSVTLSTLSKGAEQILESFGFKVKRLPNGKVTVTAAAGKALTDVKNVKAAVDSLKSKTIGIGIYKTTYLSTVRTSGTAIDGKKYAGVTPYASGGTPKAGELAMVGEEGPELVVFGQDATVFDAKKTQSLLRGSGLGARSASASGAAVAQGLASGMGQGAASVYVAARAMAGAVVTGIRDELEIRSPSKKTAALAKDIGKGLIIGLTGSRDKIKATAKDLAADIRTAFSGKKESGLLKMVDKETKKLLDLAAKRDKIAARIAEAKSFASETSRTSRESASLGNLGMEPEQVTAGGIKAGLQAKLAQIKQFTKYVDILAKKGLHKSLLKQILRMGPEAGYAYASALVGADKSTFSQINKAQEQINDASTSLGKKGADHLYDSGKNAAKGFLKGLESQQDALEKLMEKIAKAMQTSLKKALGISSPAKKMIPDGINTARGVAVGVLAGLPYIDSAMDAVAGRITGRASIPPAPGRQAIAGAGHGVVYQVQVDVHDAMDPVAVAREVQRMLLQLGRAQGGAVQLSVG